MIFWYGLKVRNCQPSVCTWIVSCLDKPTWCTYRAVPRLLSYFRLQLVFGIHQLERSQLFSYPVIIVSPQGILQASITEFSLPFPACDQWCPEMSPSHSHVHTHQTHGSRTLDCCHPSFDPIHSISYAVMEVTAQPELAFPWRPLKLVDRIHFTRYGMYRFCHSVYVYILK